MSLNRQISQFGMQLRVLNFSQIRKPIGHMVIKMGQSFFMLGLLFVGLTQGQMGQKLMEGENCKGSAVQNTQLYERNPAIERAIETAFPADKHLFIQGLITDDFSKVRLSISGHQGIYILHIVIICIFALLLIIFVPVLTFTRCCLCCSYCRASNKHHQQEGYSKCELQWPTFLILGLILLLVAICAAILGVNHDFEPKYKDFKCSLSLITHDMLSGVEYESGKMNFRGLKSYNQTFNEFFKKLKKIKNRMRLNLIPKCKRIRNIKQYLSHLNSSLAPLPNGFTAQHLPLILSYSYPLLLSLKNETKVNSTFVEILGHSQIPNTLLWNISQSIIQVNSSIFQVSNESNILFGNLTKVEGQNLLVSTLIKSQITNIERIEQNIYNTIEIVDVSVLRSYMVGSYVVVSFCIVMSVGLAVAVLWLFLKKNYLCHIGVYICCGLLWAIGILYFIIGIAFVLSNPSALYSCQYLRESLQSQQNFNKNIISLKPNIPELQTISKCLTNSQTPQYYYSTIIDGSIINLMLQIRAYLSLDYKGGNQTNRLNTTYYQLLTSTLKYRSSEIMDIEHSSMIEELRTISRTEDCFPDSWVPSLQTNSPVISCEMGSNFTQRANILSCDNLQDFVARAPGCTGCIDSSSIVDLFSINQIGPFMLQKLKKRYQNCSASGRDVIVENLNDILGRYYYEKKYKLEQVEQSVKQLMPHLKASVNALNRLINPAHKQAFDWINTEELLSNSVLPNNMDCRVLGKRIQSSLNILCSSGIAYVYTLRFLYPTAAVLILFICGFSVFFFYRHQTQRKFEKIKNLQRQIKNNDDDHEAKAQSNQIFKDKQKSEGRSKNQPGQEKQIKIEDNQDIIVIQDENDDNIQKTAPPTDQRLTRQKKFFS